MSTTPLHVFLDTDFGPDCDDVAALALLLQLCREQACELHCVTHCTGSPYGLAAIDALCRRFHLHPALGTCADKSFLSDGAALFYTPSIAASFEHGYPADAPQPDALETVVAELSKLPDQSVTFIAIGPLNHLALFLSDPIAAPLMQKKVVRIVTMAGSFEANEPFAEWNVLMDIPAARTFLEKWPGRLDFCPFEIGQNVLTGRCFQSCPENPVSLAYRLHTKGSMLRPSWDPVTVVSAILGAIPPFEWSAAGKVTLSESGITTFTPHPNGNHRYLRLTGNPQTAADWLERRLSAAIESMDQA